MVFELRTNEGWAGNGIGVMLRNYIAPQCPFTGGRAVFLARAINRMLGDTTIYDDSLTCAGLGARLSQTKVNTPDSFFITSVPNPANESCTFLPMVGVPSTNHEVKFNRGS